MWVKLEIFPNFRGENKTYLSCHHLLYCSYFAMVKRFDEPTKLGVVIPTNHPTIKRHNRNTVDGRNPANHLTCMKPCKIMGYSPYQLVQDLFHQQYYLLNVMSGKQTHFLLYSINKSDRQCHTYIALKRITAMIFWILPTLRTDLQILRSGNDPREIVDPCLLPGTQQWSSHSLTV